MASVRPLAERIRIDSASLNDKIHYLASISGTRLAYSEQDIRARSVVLDLMRGVGLAVSIDAAGNLVGRRDGHQQLSPITFGSHVDTVREAGPYDGVLGVMAAIECIRAVRDAHYTTLHPLEVIVFANEEGQQFGALCGSRALLGLINEKDLQQRDESGRTFADAIRAIGGDPAQLSSSIRKPGSIAAFLELHIEQGPTLERARTPIGIVEGISGISHTYVAITGTAAHSGTTDMEARNDALVAAARLVICVEQLARQKQCRVATVGQLTVAPNAINIIPGTVTLTIELRDLDAAKIGAALGRLQQEAAEIALQGGVRIELAEREPIQPVPCSPLIKEAIRQACTDLGVKFENLASGAGHDAQIMAKLGPMGMIFVPSRGGISHSPREFTSAEDCALGAQVLLDTILHLDERLSTGMRPQP
ncbi:MAG TPA: M20 family metallo-hydrolase [Terriglobales bacterium]|nr:M20 family metallo-hydrolase [Terriglobales bacterium]